MRDRKREQLADVSEDALRGQAVLSSDEVATDRVIRSQRSASLRAAIDELPAKQKMVLELRIYDELPFKEVAVLADCSENAAKVNFHHAVKRLRLLIPADTAADASPKPSGSDKDGEQR